MGFYVLRYDTNSYVIVLVTSELGKKEWTSFTFSNFYSKDKLKTTTINKEKIAAYAIALSKK